MTKKCTTVVKKYRVVKYFIIGNVIEDVCQNTSHDYCSNILIRFTVK